MKSLEDLKRIREEVKKSMEARSGAFRVKVIVCMGTCGIAAGARETMKTFMEEIEKAGLNDVAITATGCAGFCEKEPLVDVEIKGQPPVRYGKVDAAGARKIAKDHIIGGKTVSELLFT